MSDNGKIYILNPKAPGKDATLRVIDEIRGMVERDELAGIAGVMLYPDDNTRMFVATTRPVTRLRMFGALKWVANRFLDEQMR